MAKMNAIPAYDGGPFDGRDAATTRRSVTYGQFPNFRQAQAAVDPPWERELLARVTSLLKLPAGWDSYGAPPPRYDAAMFALTVLKSIMRPGTPMPSIVPAPMGGLQLEWHKGDIDLEVFVLGPYKGDVWWCDHSTGAEGSGDLGPDLSILEEPISKLR